MYTRGSASVANSELLRARAPKIGRRHTKDMEVAQNTHLPRQTPQGSALARFLVAKALGGEFKAKEQLLIVLGAIFWQNDCSYH